MTDKVLVARSPVGIFAFTENGELVYYELFDSPQQAFEEMPKSFLEKMAGYEIEESQAALRLLRRRFRELAAEKFNNEQLNSFLNAYGILFSKERMAGAISRDRLLIQASNACEDMEKIINLMNERLWEWFTLHYPEMKRTGDMAGRIATFGRRENFPGFKASLGVELKESDERMLKNYAKHLCEAEKTKSELETYIKQTARELMPNFSSLIDPLLAAKFLGRAGSLEKLARMIASTLQLLGAEKALFRHLRKQGKSPKFGIIFLDKRIQNAPEHKRGKVARVLAAKLMQASRIDYFSKRDDSAKLKAELEKELKAI